MSDGQFINGLTSDGGTYSRGSSILTYITVETIVDQRVKIKSIATHGRFINGSMSDGGMYSRGSSILTYVTVEAIVETELSLRKGGGGG